MHAGHTPKDSPHSRRRPFVISQPTKPYWLSRSSSGALCSGTPCAASPPTEGSCVQCDVVIIGAGITGCAAAFHLRRLRPDLKVVVVDARQLSGGATGRNGGLLWPSLNVSWPSAVATMGLHKAASIMRFEHRAMQEVMDFITGNGYVEHCEFSLFPDGGYTLFGSEEEAALELRDLQMQAAAGFADDSVPLTPEQLTERLGSACHGLYGGFHHPKVGRVWAQRLTLALALEASKVAPSGNLCILEHTAVEAVEELAPATAAYGGTAAAAEPACSCGGELASSSGGISAVAASSSGAVPGGARMCVRLAGGGQLLCSSVLHATNAFASALLPQLREHARLVPVRNQVAVTRPVPEGRGLPLHAAYSARDGYVYFSRRADNRMVIGGFRDVAQTREWGTHDDGSLDPQVSRALRSYLAHTFPDCFTLDSTDANDASGSANSKGHDGEAVTRSPASAGSSRASSATEVCMGSDPIAIGELAAHGHGQAPDSTDSANADTCCSGGGGAASWSCGSAGSNTSAVGCAADGAPARQVLGGVEPAGPSAARSAADGSTDKQPVPLVYDMEWSGILGFTKDRWPIVGPLMEAQAPAAACAAGGTGAQATAAGAASWPPAAGTIVSATADCHRGSGTANSPAAFGLGPACAVTGSISTNNSGISSHPTIMGSSVQVTPAIPVPGPSSTPVPFAATQYLCAGFTGHGMTRAYSCAKAVACMMLGAPLDPLFPADTFAPGRMGL